MVNSLFQRIWVMWLHDKANVSNQKTEGQRIESEAHRNKTSLIWVSLQLTYLLKVPTMKDLLRWLVNETSKVPSINYITATCVGTSAAIPQLLPVPGDRERDPGQYGNGPSLAYLLAASVVHNSGFACHTPSYWSPRVPHQTTGRLHIKYI